ncbi:hypothetical protein JUJ52_03095 [Virgibacillus sp. AGTR]|uniref:hypothetical protein n=1 Tax=Virgibacillus sp. AGTR TaxID=2812055 RepID=UPI001D16F40D|nr:hypothetical protein [Virgibacillus sp. AGTR]MCC2248944.1 hypothetical protein [Virgibacillus sp. AGTR]
MPNHIKTEHINRMFPFEFYDELSEHLKAFTLLNPALFLKGRLNDTTEQRKALFEQSRNNKANETLNQNNLFQVEPFGELLALDVCCPNEDKETVLKERDKRGQLPLSVIVAQLYDSSNTPIFASDVTEESIKQIPEVLWDDPNLLLGVVSFTQEEPRVAVIKIPKQIEGQLFETIQEDND